MWKKINWKSPKTWIIIVLIVITLGVLAWFFIVLPRRRKKKAQLEAARKAIEEQEQSDAVSSFSGAGPVSAELPKTEAPLQVHKDDTLPLKIGAKGTRVKKLKIWLNNVYHSQLPLTDLFDEQCIKALEKAKGISKVNEAHWEKWGLDKIQLSNE